MSIFSYDLNLLIFRGFRIVTIDPETDLVFLDVKGPDSVPGQLKATLTIANLTKGNLAYKVKTTAPRHYVVKPNQGILDGL